LRLFCDIIARSQAICLEEVTVERKFRILRIIGTIWKVLAWVTLIGGVLSSIGILVVGLLGSGGLILRQFGQDPAVMPGAMSALSGIVGFTLALATTVIYFLSLYAVGELVYLLLAVEENTRQAANTLRQLVPTEATHPETPPPSPA
jgi:hypothetical protein